MSPAEPSLSPELVIALLNGLSEGNAPLETVLVKFARLVVEAACRVSARAKGTASEAHQAARGPKRRGRIIDTELAHYLQAEGRTMLEIARLMAVGEATLERALRTTAETRGEQCQTKRIPVGQGERSTPLACEGYATKAKP